MQSVRAQLVAALELHQVLDVLGDPDRSPYQKVQAMENEGDLEGGWLEPDVLRETYRERAAAATSNALARHRAEPEGHCKSAGYLLPCDTSCPCYQEGLEAQRERVGGGTA